MFAEMERYVSIKGTKGELHELLETLEARMHMGLDAYLWLGVGVTVKFEMTEEVQYQSKPSNDWADKGFPVDMKGRHNPQCVCEKCVKARAARRSLPVRITEQQFVDILDLLEEFMDYKFEKPGRSAMAAYVGEMLATLGLEYKG